MKDEHHRLMTWASGRRFSFDRPIWAVDGRPGIVGGQADGVNSVFGPPGMSNFHKGAI